MQRVKPKMSRAKAYALLIGIIAAAVIIVWGASALFGRHSSTGPSASLLPCPYSEDIYAFGENVLYYDGMSTLGMLTFKAVPIQNIASVQQV